MAAAEDLGTVEAEAMGADVGAVEVAEAMGAVEVAEAMGADVGAVEVAEAPVGSDLALS